jgi:hypothetical protein
MVVFMEFLSNCDNAFQAIVFTVIFSDFTITSDSQLKIKNKNTKDKHLNKPRIDLDWEIITYLLNFTS